MILRALFKTLACVLALASAQTAQAEVTIQQVTSPGGIKAWLSQEPSIPFVALEIRFKGGASMDRPGKRGSVNLMTALLEEGTGDLDARGFARETEELAARFSYDSGDDVVSVSARFLTETQQDSMALLRASLVEPSFPQDAIDRVKSQVLSGIVSDRTDPDTQARARFDALLYGDHPYGTMPEGTVDSVSGLTRDDIVTAPSRHSGQGPRLCQCCGRYFGRGSGSSSG